MKWLLQNFGERVRFTLRNPRYALGSLYRELTLADERSLKAAGDRFEGYTSTRLTGIPVLALFDGARQPVQALDSGATGYVVLAETPSGRQCAVRGADRGASVVVMTTGALP